MPLFQRITKKQGLIRRFKHVVDERIEKPEAYDPSKYFQVRVSKCGLSVCVPQCLVPSRFRSTVNLTHAHGI